MSLPTKKLKRPESVLVVVYTLTGKVLLLRRTDAPDFWQSVTGSLSWEETEPRQAAIRELREETGLEAQGLQDAGLINRYTILPQWRHRYAPEVKENTENVYFLALPAEKVITLNPDEHLEYGWYAFDEAASKVFSWTNREAILKVKNSYSLSPAKAGEGKGRG
ncbi:MAG: dihydroneopterin triphosphate diphosphatase [Sulfuricaulis sp.]|uniref:dihydroneopterin triphosphate diphosphatase n=1 Tax=Sulfuricaulis sp. TaxID=2003553 RepID=UPI0025E49889|nr:dihydroneopterin triphosphate diphosphatase [Sulfuricaulis sp.]MCR4347178.1 dihydroneopterin triphosphate diphosphatase [Sulfuricaulis sp.]